MVTPTTGFLDLNLKAYLPRYTDDLPVNFNITIAQREFLAELDYTIISLIKGFNFEVNEPGKGTKYTQLIARQDHRLLLENHVLSNIPKYQFVYLAPQQIYEMRHIPLFGPIETEYSSSKPAKK